MKYLMVDPRRKLAEPITAASFEQALALAGLTPGKVDFGTIRRGLGIVVDEFGLFERPTDQSYFAIDQRMYAGRALIFAYNEAGHNVDFEYDGHWFGCWFNSVGLVERAIRNNEIERPIIAIGEEVVWRWPAPRPDPQTQQKMAEQMAAHGGETIIDGDTIIRTVKTESPT